MDLDISQGSTLTLENSDFNTKATFIGKFDDSDVKHGYDLKMTIYGARKIKYSAMVSLGSFDISFIDFDNRNTIRDFFKDQTKLNVIDEDGNVTNGVRILGESLKFTKVYDVEGSKFYSTSFEVGR